MIPRIWVLMIAALFVTVISVVWSWQIETVSTEQGGWNDPERFMIAATRGQNKLTIIDTETADIVGQVTLGFSISAVEVSELGDLVYVAHAKEHKLSLVNLETGELDHVIDLPLAPEHLADDAEAGILISDSKNGGMALVDLYGREVLFFNPDIPPNSGPIFSASGTIAYYHSSGAGEVGAVSMETGRSLWRIATPKFNADIPLVRSIDGFYLVVTFADKGEVAALDSKTGKPLAIHRFGQGLQQPFVTSNGYFFLIPDPASKQVHILSQKDFSLQASVSLGRHTSSVVAGVLDSVGLAVADDRLFTLDLADVKRRPLKSYPLAAQITDELVTADSMQAFFAAPEDHSIITFDMLHNRLDRISLDQPANIIAMGSTNSICH